MSDVEKKAVKVAIEEKAFKEIRDLLLIHRRISGLPLGDLGKKVRKNIEGMLFERLYKVFLD